MAGEPTQIPWPMSSAPGAATQESAGRLYNAYVEPLGEGGPAKIAWHKSPGLTKFSATGVGGANLSTFRGGLLVKNLAYLAFKDTLVTLDINGTVTNVGLLTGSDRVTFARNNKVPTPDICVNTALGAFLVTQTTIIPWPDPDLPVTDSVAFQDSYFFWTVADRRAFASAINDTTVNGLAFTTIQSRAQGTLLRGIPYGGLMYFFGSSWCEVFQDTAQPAPGFPYSRVTVIDRGLLGPAAIAGWEEGFGKLYWVADDFGVYRFATSSPFMPEKVSNPDLDRLIKAADPTTLEASCYVFAGKSIWVLSSPTWTWEFNINTEKWTERFSDIAGLQGRWRGTGSVNAFGKWLVGSNATGNITFIDDTAGTEEGDPQFWQMESGPVQAYPVRMRVGRADFYFVAGVGRPGGTDQQRTPTVAISWSDDGGRTWGIPVLRSLGELNDSKRRVAITGVGSTSNIGRRWRIRVSDDVYTGFIGASMSASARAN